MFLGKVGEASCSSQASYGGLDSSANNVDEESAMRAIGEQIGYSFRSADPLQVGSLPWIIFGDFNVVRCRDERSGCHFDSGEANEFNDFISRAGLFNLPLGGRRFTRNWVTTRNAFEKQSRDDILHSLLDWDIKAEAGLINETDIDKREELIMDLNHLDQMHRDDLKQKCRLKWAVEGDENTCFFHSLLKHRYANSNIKGVQVNGLWCDSPSLIKQAAVKHFSSRFKEVNLLRPTFSSPLFRKLRREESNYLESSISMKEIKTAIWDCDSSKALGLDGYNFKFIKAYWEVIKFDFQNCVKHFEASGTLANGCNPSFITLIPKKPDPLGFSDYRPISLIGCVYKVISKILASRLAKVIPSVIGPNQTAFIAGRQILDGCLVANEIISMAHIENLKLMVFKVDFEKAFDSEFRMERGLRQGDSLSPFLFLLVAEALQIATLEACNKGLFKGVSLANGGTNLSLLQYADDALFFGECRLFGIGISPDVVEEVAVSLGCTHDVLPFLYLGLPVGKSMRLCEGWNEVVNRFRVRLSAWKAKTLSIGGRLTLIKSILGSLPLYYFSLFKAPQKIIKILESIRCRFFWGFLNSQRGISWVKWRSILLNSNLGGLGVGSLFAKNLSLLSKWKWRYLTEKNALWRMVIKEFYGEGGGFDSLVCSSNSKGVWCDILKAVKCTETIVPSFKHSFYLKVSNGRNVSFWHDPWCGNGLCLKNLFPRLFALDVYQDCK
ncbi:putative RNA-directed DNA polymerase, partial [Tanacetum coccineum]